MKRIMISFWKIKRRHVLRACYSLVFFAARVAQAHDIIMSCTVNPNSVWGKHCAFCRTERDLVLHTCFDSCPNFHDMCVEGACGKCQWCQEEPTCGRFSTDVVVTAFRLLQKIPSDCANYIALKDRSEHHLGRLDETEKARVAEILAEAHADEGHGGGDAPQHQEKPAPGDGDSEATIFEEEEEDRSGIPTQGCNGANNTEHKEPPDQASTEVTAGHLVVHHGNIARVVDDSTKGVFTIEKATARDYAGLLVVVRDQAKVEEIVKREDVTLVGFSVIQSTRQSTDFGVAGVQVGGHPFFFGRQSSQYDLRIGAKVRALAVRLYQVP